MNTAAGMVSGTCVMTEGSPEPDTHVNYAPTPQNSTRQFGAFLARGVSFPPNCWVTF